jgi:hypothetical protein
MSLSTGLFNRNSEFSYENSSAYSKETTLLVYEQKIRRRAKNFDRDALALFLLLLRL